MAAKGMRQKLEGHRFGRWRVVEYAGAARGGSRYLCMCTCGTERVIFRSNLVSGKTTSCGCGKSASISEARTAHGHSRPGDVSPTYSSWGSMVNRCTNPNNQSYPRYGGRGIRVCDRWRNSFEAFLEDMGEKPKQGMSIERLDVNGHYEPGNCVWATPRRQSRNTRRTKLTTERVRTLRRGEITPKEAANRWGVSISTIYAARRGKNWPEVL